MPILDWFRWIPTPSYGTCGSASKDCAPKKPIDEMDTLFAEHDSNLYMANQIVSYYEREAARREADKILGSGLRALDSKKLSIYGRLYRRFSMLIFRP